MGLFFLLNKIWIKLIEFEIPNYLVKTYSYIMIKRLYLLLFPWVAVFSCETPKTPDQIWEESKTQIFNPQGLSFQSKMVWENPNFHEFDTTFRSFEARKIKDEYFDYAYIGKRDNYTFAYLGGVLQSIDHEKKTVKITSIEQDSLNFINTLSNNSFLSFSPLGLMKKEGWSFVKDTIVDNKIYFDYLQIEMDTTIDKTKVLLENHLFINPSNSIPVWYSRRLYHHGKRNQLIEIYFSDYTFSEDLEELTLEIPSSYVSKTERESEPQLPLEVGEKAPDFELVDMEGNPVRLSGLKGKRVLLDFSMINCGWCKIAINKFKDEDFAFDSNLVPLYINPVDSKELMEKYLRSNSIPFPVLVGASELGKSYKVSGYPTFYIIDENGKIEFVQVGFSDNFIDQLNRKVNS